MPTGYERIKNKYDALPDDVQNYLGSFPLIIDIDDKDTLDMLVAYLFVKIERAQRRTLYGVAVKKYRVNKDIAQKGVKNAQKGINSIRLSRSDFYLKYRLMADGERVNKKTRDIMKNAENFRNEVTHGKIVKDADKSKVIKSILDYIKLLNEQTETDFGFTPFGSMKGFSGRTITLNNTKSTSLLRQIVKNRIPPQ